MSTAVNCIGVEESRKVWWLGTKFGFLGKLIGFLIAMDVHEVWYPLKREGCSNFVNGLNDFMINLMPALLRGLQRGTRMRKDLYTAGSVDTFW